MMSAYQASICSSVLYVFDLLLLYKQVTTLGKPLTVSKISLSKISLSKISLSKISLSKNHKDDKKLVVDHFAESTYGIFYL